jgi:UDP-N-acetylmuramate--alanine ligase
MITSINDFKNPFFIGIAGSGMSAIAQYLKGIGKNVSGSDRFFVPANTMKQKKNWNRKDSLFSTKRVWHSY